jgi:hypothetical protein
VQPNPFCRATTEFVKRERLAFLVTTPATDLSREAMVRCINEQLGRAATDGSQKSAFLRQALRAPRFVRDIPNKGH